MASEHRRRNLLENMLQHQIHPIGQTTSNRVCHRDLIATEVAQSARHCGNRTRRDCALIRAIDGT